jgi:hypothetical protein
MAGMVAEQLNQLPPAAFKAMGTQQLQALPPAAFAGMTPHRWVNSLQLQ